MQRGSYLGNRPRSLRSFTAPEVVDGVTSPPSSNPIAILGWDAVEPFRGGQFEASFKGIVSRIWITVTQLHVPQAFSFPSLLQLRLRIEVPLWRDLATARHPAADLPAEEDSASDATGVS